MDLISRAYTGIQTRANTESLFSAWRSEYGDNDDLLQLRIKFSAHEKEYFKPILATSKEINDEFPKLVMSTDQEEVFRNFQKKLESEGDTEQDNKEFNTYLSDEIKFITWYLKLPFS
jgi:hypothetical protein